MCAHLVITARLLPCPQMLQPPNVLGWSMGGMIATSLVALHGDELGKASPAAGCLTRRMALASEWWQQRFSLVCKRLGADRQPA